MKLLRNARGVVDAMVVAVIKVALSHVSPEELSRALRRYADEVDALTKAANAKRKVMKKREADWRKVEAKAKPAKSKPS